MFCQSIDGCELLVVEVALVCELLLLPLLLWVVLLLLLPETWGAVWDTSLLTAVLPVVGAVVAGDVDDSLGGILSSGGGSVAFSTIRGSSREINDNHCS